MVQLEFPAGTKFFDWEDVPVAKLPDGSCFAFDPDKRPFSASLTFSAATPVKESVFRSMLADELSRKRA